MPCRKKFPHLVEMHKKHAQDGLAIISVSLDRWENDPKEDEPTKGRVLTFLKEQNASFTNLLMTEESEVREAKLRFRGTPCIFVFNRQGKWTQFSSDKVAIDYDAVDRLVLESLKEK